MIHHHIRWSGGKLDWERFQTRAEAEMAARELARSDETYTIEEFGDDCRQCEQTIYALNEQLKRRGAQG